MYEVHKELLAMVRSSPAQEREGGAGGEVTPLNTASRVLSFAPPAANARPSAHHHAPGHVSSSQLSVELRSSSCVATVRFANHRRVVILSSVTAQQPQGFGLVNSGPTSFRKQGC
ncbi:hypothetical protein Droror1_Dr00021146 [Drosera rotundifolia]